MRIPRALLFIIVGALFVRLFLFGMILGNFGEEGFFLGDSKGFYQTALNLLEGHGFSRDTSEPFRPSAFFPPLYPLLLAGSLAMAGSVVPLILFQIGLSSLMPFFVWKIGQGLTERKSVWYGAAGLMAFEPLGMLWSLTLLTDVTAVFFLVIAALFFIRLLHTGTTQDAIFAGAALALSALTRPEPQYLFVVAALTLAILWFLKKISARSALIFVAIFLAVLSPWLVRNIIHFGSPTGTTTGIRNIYSSLGTSVITYKTGRPYHEVQDELHKTLAEKYGFPVSDITENPAVGPVLLKEGLKILKENPKETAVTLMITVNSFFTQDLYTTYLRYYRVIPPFPIEFSPSVVLLREGPLALASQVWSTMGALSIIPVLGRFLWVAFTLFAMAGAYFAIKNRGRTRLAGIVLASIILLYAAGSQVAGFSDHGRHRYPANAFIFILASYGAARAISSISSRVKRTLTIRLHAAFL